MRLSHQHVRSSRDLGQVIAAARRHRGLTQRQVAEALGVTQAWISEVEQGKQRAWIGQVLRLMAHLQIALVATVTDDASVSKGTGNSTGHVNIDDLID